MATTSSSSESPTQTMTRLFTALSSLQPPPPLPPASITAPAPPNILRRLTHPSAAAARSILLTLHVLFPHDFLPALDLLDRGLVNCFTTPPPQPDTGTRATSSGAPITTISPPTNLNQPHPPNPGPQEVFYIQSASAITDSHASRGGDRGGAAQGRFRNAMARGKATDTFYEVRLDAWNCSCAAFAFAAFVLLGGGEGGAGGGEGEVGVQGGVVQPAAQARDGEAGAAAAGGGGDGTNVGEGRATQAMEAGFRFGGTAAEGGVAPVCKHILAAAMAKNLPEFAMPPAREGTRWRREMGVKELAGWGAGWGDRG